MSNLALTLRQVLEDELHFGASCYEACNRTAGKCPGFCGFNSACCAYGVDFMGECV